jgi:ribosomal protein S18 acetylase RimI-like enzyme
MAAVQSAGRTGVKRVEGGVRPFDISRDLRPVAELIADSFAHELDERGAAALREMRMMSRVGGVLGVMSATSSELSDFFGGFVYVEDGSIVGNVTVQRGDKSGARWHIANVAVQRDYRGRGISRRLMEEALSYIRRQGGKWVVLQVYEANTVARTLYDHLAFTTVGGMSDLQAERAVRTVRPAEAARPSAELAPFSSSQGQALFELANSQLGPMSQWWRPVRRSDFDAPIEQQLSERLWEIVGRKRIFRRAIQNTRRFDAALVLTASRWRGNHRLQMWVRPEHYGQFEPQIVEWAMNALADYPAWPITVSVPGDHHAAIDALTARGFQVQRTLLTMRLQLTPDAPILVTAPATPG